MSGHERDEFEYTASGASVMRVDGIDAAWINNNQPADVVVMRCTKCGWELEMRAGDPPIPHNDPRTRCPHTT
jgi:hypothetical protein